MMDVLMSKVGPEAAERLAIIAMLLDGVAPKPIEVKDFAPKQGYFVPKVGDKVRVYRQDPGGPKIAQVGQSAIVSSYTLWWTQDLPSTARFCVNVILDDVTKAWLVSEIEPA